MLVVMQEGATEQQVQNVINRLVTMNFTVHRSTGVLHTVLGRRFPWPAPDCALLCWMRRTAPRFSCRARYSFIAPQFLFEGQYRSARPPQSQKTASADRIVSAAKPGVIPSCSALAAAGSPAFCFRSPKPGRLACGMALCKGLRAVTSEVFAGKVSKSASETSMASSAIRLACGGGSTSTSLKRGSRLACAMTAAFSNCLTASKRNWLNFRQNCR